MASTFSCCLERGKYLLSRSMLSFYQIIELTSNIIKKKMEKTVFFLSLATTIGNMLQGWHGSAIAGALLYVNIEFDLEGKLQIEGLIVASAIFAAFISTLCAGPLADCIGRKTVLNISAFFYSLGAIVMAWSPDVYALIVGRFLIGVAVGFASSIAPLYISECSPPDIRGKLLTFPQMFGSVGTFLAYVLAFGLSLMPQPMWRMMLGIPLLPSLFYVALCSWYIPESPRWLVSKGQMRNAKQVLQRLRNRDDVAVELALLVEGLGYGNVTMEEYILQPADIACPNAIEQEGSHIEIIRADDEGAAWIATPVMSNHDNDAIGMAGSLRSDDDSQKLLPIDPLVTFMGSLQSNVPEDLHTFESFKDGETFLQFDEENPPLQSPTVKGYDIDDVESGEDAATPLLSNAGDPGSPYSTLSQSGKITPPSLFSNFFYGSVKSIISESLGQEKEDDTNLTNDIGGGWQLGWQWSHEEGKSGEFKTVFLHQQGVMGSSRTGSVKSILSGMRGSGQNLVLQASSLVGTPAQSCANLLAEGSVGPAMVHPANTSLRGPAWSDIMEPGVQRALLMGCALQFLQQFSGLNAVLYYTPQILQASGAEGLLSNLSKDSTSLLASTISAFLMIPFILWAIRLMDTSGRRAILLRTLPILSVCLVAVILISKFLPKGLLQAGLSFLVMTSFICCFVMGFGPVPNILCAEIFPTRVRGLCNGICAATMWLSTVIITYGFPATISKIGLNGVLGIFACVSLFSWVYVYLKVPETKGMPLEVISELFAVSAATTTNPTKPKTSSNEEEEKLMRG